MPLRLAPMAMMTALKGVPLGNLAVSVVLSTWKPSAEALPARPTPAAIISAVGTSQ